MREDIIRKLSLAVALIAWLAVLCTGLLAPGPMIGDEVTHFYMLKNQSERLPTPCFQVQIPVGPDGGEKDLRFYPHVAVWHYIGAILFRLTGSIAVIQVYQSIFLLQLLFVTYAMVKKLGNGVEEGPLMALLMVVSLPMTLIFSVAFYQDVPGTAQVLTAFWLLFSGRWLLATLFMSLAFGIKENMILFLPAFLVVMTVVVWKNAVWRKVAAIATSLAIFLVVNWFIYYVILTYGHEKYYPYATLKVTVNRLLLKIPGVSEKISTGQMFTNHVKQIHRLETSLFKHNVLSNHPGDLRVGNNWFIYGGGVLWLILLLGVVGLFVRRKEIGPSVVAGGQNLLLVFAGGSYIALVCFFLNIPEARFFMPGVVLISIAASTYAARLALPRFCLYILIVASLAQGGVVLYKTFGLRHVSSGIMEAIDYLKNQPPKPNRIFMYPEGNYRLFPCKHDWYLNYMLKDLWRADNSRRIEIFHFNGIGAVVIKKHLVGAIDPEMNNLGVYPDFFVRDLDKDSRFKKVLDNRDVTIYTVPPKEKKINGSKL